MLVDPRTVNPVAIALVVYGTACGDPDGRTRYVDWHFTDVTVEAGLDDFRHETGATGGVWIPESIGSGVAFSDVDGDGWIDLVLVAGGTLDVPPSNPALALYRNLGNGRFEEVTAAAGLAGVRAYGQGIYPADIDGDGDDDLFLTALGPNILLRNDGGTFVDVSEESGLSADSSWSTAAAFFDADRDGDLDLFVGNYLRWSIAADAFCSLDGVNKSYCTPTAYESEPSRFFRNDGNGRFTDRTAEHGMASTEGNTMGAVAFDYDRDGWTDLYVANDLKANLLFHNNGDGTFTEVALQSGAAYDERGYARAGMGVDAGVLDSTLRANILVGNFSKEPIAVFQYTENGVFLSRESATRLLLPSIPTLTFGLFLFDANLDGFADVFCVNGHVQTDIERVDREIRYRQPVHLFVNAGNGTFRDVAPELGLPLTKPLAGRGGAYGDFDRDGDLDVIIVENGGGAHLWRNDLPDPSARALRIDLAATRSNPNAIGTRVRVHAGGRVQEQQRRGGGSYLSTSEKTLTFGLAGWPTVDSVIVFWPSGIRTVHRDLASGIVTLREK